MMDRSVKLAQQLSKRMEVFPLRPSTLFPLESLRVAVAVRVVTPTETQFPCRPHTQSALTDAHLQPSFRVFLGGGSLWPRA